MLQLKFLCNYPRLIEASFIVDDWTTRWRSTLEIYPRKLEAGEAEEDHSVERTCSLMSRDPISYFQNERHENEKSNEIFVYQARLHQLVENLEGSSSVG